MILEEDINRVSPLNRKHGQPLTAVTFVWAVLNRKASFVYEQQYIFKGLWVVGVR